MLDSRLLRLDVGRELFSLGRAPFLLELEASTDPLQYCGMARNPVRFWLTGPNSFQKLVEVDSNVLRTVAVRLVAKGALLVLPGVLLAPVLVDDCALVQGTATELINVLCAPCRQFRRFHAWRHNKPNSATSIFDTCQQRPSRALLIFSGDGQCEGCADNTGH